MDSITPKVYFQPILTIIPVIYGAMECSLKCNKTFGKEYRWFEGYPELVLSCGKHGHNAPSYQSFAISIERANALYQKIKALFPTGKFMTQNHFEYPLTISQIFKGADNVWASPDLESLFYCPTPELPVGYEEWGQLARTFDYTYMMSDSSSSFRSGREHERRMLEEQAKLDVKVCSLWYNHILSRARTNPQDACFGMNRYEPWNTLEECYKLFNMQPQEHPLVEIPKPPANSPSVGFPSHPKKVGWNAQDIKHNWPLTFLTYEEYLESK